jgi:hypothetical protein
MYLYFFPFLSLTAELEVPGTISTFLCIELNFYPVYRIVCVEVFLSPYNTADWLVL